MEHRRFLEYITVQQLIVVETLLLGLRKKCLDDYFVNVDGHLKVESTRVLIEAGYSVIDNIDTDTRSASQLTLNTANGKVETSQILLGITNCKPQGKRDVIILNPDVKFEVMGLANKKDETFETGVERLCRSKINALVVVATESEFTKMQEKYPSLLPPAANLQPFFTESEQHFTNKSGSTSDEEVVCRGCKIASPATNGASRIVFSIFRPNVLQKQVDALTDNKASLEIQRDEQTEDASYLTTEILALKKEIESLNSEKSDIQVGSADFEVERDIMREEKAEVELERDALKIEAVALRKKIHKLEIEIEAFHEVRSKKTYSLSDSEDDDIKTTTTTTTTTTKHEESMEVGLDDEDDDDLKYSDLIVKDDDDTKSGFTNMGGDGLSIKNFAKKVEDDSDEENEENDEEEKRKIKKSIKIEEDEESGSEKSEKVDLDDNEGNLSMSVTEDEDDEKSPTNKDDKEDSEKENKEDKEDEDKDIENKEDKEDKDKENKDDFEDDENENKSDKDDKDDSDFHSDDEVQLEKKKPATIKSEDGDSSDWSEDDDDD